MNNNNSSLFLGYLQSFRGFAIINIVAIHAIGLALYFVYNNADVSKNTFSIVNQLLFHNSTIYFAVISGLLFSAVLKSKGYKHFYLNKFKNVLLAYLFLTLFFSVFNPTPSNFFALHTDFTLYLEKALHNFINGTAQFTYWYIPVMIFLYLVTPLLDYIMNLKRWPTIFIVLIVLLPLGISRAELIDVGEVDYLHLSTMIYFMGAYAAGMYLGANPEDRLNWVKKNFRLLMLITAFSSAALIYFELKSVDRFGAWSLRGTLFYIQKMCLSGIFLILFKNWGERQPDWLGQIAKYSFTIYFLHAFFLLILYSLLMPLSTLNIILPLKLFMVCFIFLLSSIALSILVGRLFKGLFGKYSRMLVGS